MGSVWGNCLGQTAALGLAGYWAVTGSWWGALAVGAVLVVLNSSARFNAVVNGRLERTASPGDLAAGYRLAAAVHLRPARRRRATAHARYLEGRALYLAGRHEEAAGKLAEAVDVRRVGPGAPEREVRWLSAVLDLHGSVLGALGRYEEAVGLTARAVAAAESGPALDHGRRLYNHGVHLRDAGRPEHGLAAAERAAGVLAAAGRADGPERADGAGRPGGTDRAELLDLWAGALGLQSECLAELGRTEAAVEPQRRAVRLLDEAGGAAAEPAARATAWHNLAARLHNAGRWEEADRAYHRARAIEAVAARRAGRDRGADQPRAAPRPRR